jgi:hypothetical protein
MGKYVDVIFGAVVVGGVGLKNSTIPADVVARFRAKGAVELKLTTLLETQRKVISAP